MMNVAAKPAIRFPAADIGVECFPGYAVGVYLRPEWPGCRARASWHWPSAARGLCMAKMTAQMEAELIKLFSRFDTNRNGFIDEKEFGAILDSLGYNEDEQIRSLEFAAIDEDEDGRLRFQEFADWWLDNR